MNLTVQALVCGLGLSLLPQPWEVSEPLRVTLGNKTSSNTFE
jgi:hypothetical protein